MREGCPLRVAGVLRAMGGGRLVVPVRACGGPGFPWPWAGAAAGGVRAGGGWFAFAVRGLSNRLSI